METTCGQQTARGHQDPMSVRGDYFMAAEQLCLDFFGWGIHVCLLYECHLSQTPDREQGWQVTVHHEPGAFLATVNLAYRVQ